MRYDVLSLGPTETVLGKWPELRNQPEFVKYGMTAQGDMILRWVLLLTDLQSPYPRRYPDLPERKAVAMRKVGLVPAAPLGRLLMAWQHEGARDMAIRYLRMQHNVELAAALASEESLWQNIAKVQAPIESEFDDGDDDVEDGAAPGEAGKPKKRRMSIKSEEEKESARQQAYKTRAQLERDMPAHVERVKRQMQAIFRGDDLLQNAVADAYEDSLKDDGDSVEAEYLRDEGDEDDDEV